MNLFYARMLLTVSFVFATAVFAMVGAVFIGYAYHSAFLISVAPALQGMSLLTATGLTGIAVALMAGRRHGRLVATVASWIALLVSLAALASHAVLGSDVLSPWIAHEGFGMTLAASGRTSIATALGIALLAVAQLERSRSRTLSSDMMASATALLSGTALLGYAYGVHDLYAVFLFNTIAIHTAAALFLLSLATMFAQAHTGWAATIASSRSGGGATRRQLAFTLIPPFAGGMLLHAAETHAMGYAFAMTLLVVLTITPLIALILHDGATLDALDLERESKDRLKARIADDLHLRLAEQATALSRASDERAKAESAMYGAQRMEAVGQLTGGIAHDFNNLLMAVASNLHLSQKQLAPGHPARTFLDHAASATQRGTRLTGQLLAFSRTQRLDVRPMQLDPAIQIARDLIGNALGPRISIDIRFDAPGVWVLADPDQLQLALLNLALNARDAMPTGGAFRIETADIARPAGDLALTHAAIRVTDTGTGMSPEVVARAMEPFFTTKERGKGTGLGLAQVYGVVKQCGGELRIDSELGRGTTFEILLKRTQPALEPVPGTAWDRSAEAPDERAGPVTRSGRLLVIDDDEHVRTAMAEMFRSDGYEVLEAGNGTEGLDAIDTMKPALAIIDFLMPGLNGADVARLARVKQPGLPIIFVSGYSDTLALDEISDATVLRKPVDAQTLFAAVTRALA